MPVRRYPHYAVTVNNYTAEHIALLTHIVNKSVNNRTRVTFACFQEEIAPSTDTPHLQCYIQIGNKMAPKDFTQWLQGYLMVGCHVEGCRGSAEDNVDYCTKDESRKADTAHVVTGKYVALPAVDSTQGQRMDLEAVRTAIHDGKSLAELHSEFFEAFAKYDRFLTKYWTDFQNSNMTKQLIESTSGTTLRPWQQSLLALCTSSPRSRVVQWWYETTGNVGKSFMARHLALHHEFVVVQMMKKADMIHLLSKSITTTRGVVFDLTRSSEEGAVKVIYEVAEMLADGYICSGKYDSTALRFMPLHIVCFANYAPDLNAMSRDRWDIHHVATL